MDPVQAQIQQEMDQANAALISNTDTSVLPDSANSVPASIPPTNAQQDPVAAGIQQEMNEAKYSTPGQMALTALEGGARGLVSSPVVSAVEGGLSKAGFDQFSPENQQGRQETNPWLHGGTETAGLVLGALTGAGEAALLSKAGEAAAPLSAALGLGGKGAGIFSKIGSSAVRGAAENGLYQVQDEASKLIQGRPSAMVETALPNVGLAAIIGGTFGAGAGGVSALWKATAGSKTASLLSSVADRVGGIDGIAQSPVESLVSRTGIDVPPELKSVMSDDPVLKEWGSKLNQTDTSNSGREFQQTLKDNNNQAGDILAESLGTKTESVPKQVDKYTDGVNVANALADEVAQKVDPLAKQFNEFREKSKGALFEPSISERAPQSKIDINATQNEVDSLSKEVMSHEFGNNPEQALDSSEKLLQSENKLEQLQRDAVTPGTSDLLVNKVNELANQQRWVTSPSSDIMKEVNRVVKEIPGLKDLPDLTAYISRVGENMQSDPLNGPMNRAGGMIKSLLKETEGDLITKHLAGTEGGEEAVKNFRDVQKKWAAVSDIKDQLDDRLHIKGSTSSYADRIRAEGTQSGEAVLRKLSGKTDANILDLLQQNFPKTAQAVRDAHVNQILSSAKSEGKINPNDVINGLNKLSPQLKSFVTGEAAPRIDAIGQMLEKLKDSNFNYPNTGRTVDKLREFVPASAVGMISMLLGHNPAMSFLLGGLTKYLSHDAPDAARLGLLKWLGSNKPVEPGAFKSMVDFIHHTIEGNDVMSSAAKALVSGASKVIPASLMPTEKKIKTLQDQVRDAGTNPQPMQNSGEGLHYYMPNHGIATTATASNAVSVLNSLRPTSTKNAPLDPEIKPSPLRQAKYERQLSIAEQPLMLAHFCAQGQLTNEDVALCKSLYPDFVAQLSGKLTQSLVDHLASGKQIPHELQIGISKLMSQPMTSALFPQRIANNQAAFVQSNQQQQQTGQAQVPKPSIVGMRNIKSSSRLSLDNSRNDDA